MCIRDRKSINNIGIRIIIIPNYTFKWVEGLPVLLLIIKTPNVFVTFSMDSKGHQYQWCTLLSQLERIKLNWFDKTELRKMLSM